MTLGLGILLSVLIVVAAWQVDKRDSWRRLGKALAWAAGIIFLVGLLWGASVGWSAFKTRRAASAQALLIKQGKLREYWNIRLGMTGEEVRYIKGAPTTVDSDAWSYDKQASRDGTGYVVRFDRSNRVATIVCMGNYGSDCDPLASLRITDTEANILATLGAPVEVPTISGTGVKTLHFGPNSEHFNVAVGLEKNTAVAFVVTASEHDSKTTLPRAIQDNSANFQSGSDVTLPPLPPGFVLDPTPSAARGANFDLASAVAVPNPFAKFDCVDGQVVRYDRAGRAVCLTASKTKPWEQYQDSPLAKHGTECSRDFVKLYDGARDEYCVSFERIDHLGAVPSTSSSRPRVFP